VSRLKPEMAWTRIVEDSRRLAKSRIVALEQIARPSLNRLKQLFNQRKELCPQDCDCWRCQSARCRSPERIDPRTTE
jgi:hypothetical protein